MSLSTKFQSFRVIFLCANQIVKYCVNIDLDDIVGGSSEKELIPGISRYFPDTDTYTQAL